MLLGLGEELLLRDLNVGRRGLLCARNGSQVLLVWTRVLRSSQVLLTPSEAGVVSISFYRCETKGAAIHAAHKGWRLMGTQAAGPQSPAPSKHSI